MYIYSVTVLTSTGKDILILSAIDRDKALELATATCSKPNKATRCTLLGKEISSNGSVVFLHKENV